MIPILQNLADTAAHLSAVVGTATASLLVFVVALCLNGMLCGIVLERLAFRSGYNWDRMMSRGFCIGALIGGGWSVYALKTMTLSAACVSVLGVTAIVAAIAAAVGFYVLMLPIPTSEYP